MLSVVKEVVQVAAQHNVEVSFCGEMARKPLDAMALIGVGVRSLSVSASAIGPLKAMICSLTIAGLEEYIGGMLASTEPSLRHWLENYAKDHGIAV